MVPDASLRNTTWMGSEGISALLSALIAGSSHRVILPLKIFASVGASSVSRSTA